MESLYAYPSGQDLPPCIPIVIEAFLGRMSVETVHASWVVFGYGASIVDKHQYTGAPILTHADAVASLQDLAAGKTSAVSIDWKSLIKLILELIGKIIL